MGINRSKPKLKGKILLNTHSFKLKNTIFKYFDFNDDDISQRGDPKYYKNYVFIFCGEHRFPYSQNDLIIGCMEFFNQQDLHFCMNYVVKNLVHPAHRYQSPEMNPKICIIILRTKYFEENRENVMQQLYSFKDLADYIWEIVETEDYFEDKNTSHQHKEFDYNTLYKAIISKLDLTG